MPAPEARLSFFKLIVPDIDAALAFWNAAFGFEVTMSFEEPDFREVILALPGQPAGPNLMLVQYNDGRDVSTGQSHGPIGFACTDVRASHDHALACDAERLTDVFEAGGVKLAIIKSPQGHEIELVELPAA